MKKMIAVALLAVPLTFAQATSGSAPADNTTGTAKTKKHSKKHSKKNAADTNTAPATK